MVTFWHNQRIIPVVPSYEQAWPRGKRQRSIFMVISHSGPIVPVASFADVQSTIEQSLAPIHRSISPETAAPVSIRLSQAALSDLELTAESLATMLSRHHLTLAGVSGVGIQPGIKEHIHAPDWRNEARLSFMFAASNLIAEIDTVLVGADADAERAYGITTNALSSRSWVDTDMPGNWAALTLNLTRVVQHLAQIRDRTGITIHIDLEAEPGSMLRDTADIVWFWTEWVVGRGAAMLSDRMQVEGSTAADTMLRHVRLALDTAHSAVVFDDPAASLDAFQANGIGIGRLQASAALEVTIPANAAELRRNLESLRSDRLLQQVVAARDGEIVQRYGDLPEALDAIGSAAGETWRIHTHAPLVADRYGIYRATRDVTAGWISGIADRGLDLPLIELRSANWAVLPADDRQPREHLIAREAEWVRSHGGV